MYSSRVAPPLFVSVLPHTTWCEFASGLFLGYISMRKGQVRRYSGQNFGFTSIHHPKPDEGFFQS
jgi:hypothetical protein